MLRKAHMRSTSSLQKFPQRCLLKALVTLVGLTTAHFSFPPGTFPCLSPPVQFSSVEDGIYAPGKAHMRSTPSLRSFLSFAFEYTSSASSFFYASLPRAIDGAVHVLGSSPARGVVCLKLLNTSDHPRREPLAIGAVPAQSFC